ncbi:MAG: MMPL family transporter, partial [Thermoleophilia bacterium]
MIIATVIAGAMGGQKTIADEDYGNGESKAADKAIAAADFRDAAEEQVFIQGKGSVKIGAPAFTAAVDDTVSRLEETKGIDKIESPLAKGNEGQLSRDGSAALVTFKIAGEDDVAKDRVGATLAATKAAQEAHPDLRIEQFGDASADKALSKAFEDDFKKAEFLSLPITLIILILAFGALVAAGVPLLLGVTAVAATIGLLAPISQLFPMDESVGSVVLLVGLAVGVDYSMFYLRRKMEERDAGRSSEDALEFAAATSGQAVLISGLTVMIAMAGMFFAGSIVFQSFAIGTILVVGIAVLGSLTVLPAVLSKLGDKVEKGRVPIIGRMRHRNHGESRVWGWILDRVLRRPVVSLVVAGGLLVALAIPALNMHTVNPGVAAMPKDLEVMKVYDRIQAAFPGGPLPAIVAVQA